MILDEIDFELQAGSEATYRWTLSDLDLTGVSEAKFALFSDFGKVPVLVASSLNGSGARIVVNSASGRIDLILPGSATKSLVTRGAEFIGRFQCELRFSDGSEVIFARGPATVARDGII